MAGKKRPPRYAIIFLTCLMTIPTLYTILYPEMCAGDLKAYIPHFAVGALLGICHLVLRPILRLISAPVGCLTLGLVGTAIDIGLIYLCSAVVKGFQRPAFLFVLLAVLMINFICVLAGGRRK